MIELYQFEGCPFCRKVREKLTELQIDYICRNTPHGSPRRQELVKIGGKDQVPLLVDKEKGIKMYESDAIVAYLEKEYGKNQG